MLTPEEEEGAPVQAEQGEVEEEGLAETQLASSHLKIVSYS